MRFNTFTEEGYPTPAYSEDMPTYSVAVNNGRTTVFQGDDYSEAFAVYRKIGPNARLINHLMTPRSI